MQGNVPSFDHFTESASQSTSRGKPKMLAIRNMIVAGVLLAFSGALHAADAPDARVQRMTDAVVKMLPMGAIFEDAAAKNPKWPMQEKPDGVTPEQLACIRGELSVAGFRRSRMAEVENYAKANPSRLDAEIKLLESGAADLFGKIIAAGAAKAGGGPEVSPEAILGEATSEQVLSFVTFISDPNYAELHKLSGFGDALNITKSQSENEKSGSQLGASLAAQQMIKAMGTCKVPPSAYL